MDNREPGSATFCPPQVADGGTTSQERIGYGFELATARRPQGDEGNVLHQTFQQFLDTYQTDPDEALESLVQDEHSAASAESDE